MLFLTTAMVSCAAQTGLGDNLLYLPGSQTTIVQSGLGSNSSHGCVRLSIDNAKWIYDNISVGTKVVTY